MKRNTIAPASASIFDYQNWVERLAAEPTTLDRLSDFVDFEAFRSDLEVPLLKPAQGPGGRPAFDAVLMFRVLLLQRLYNLSDDQTEFQIRDRFSFQRFLGLTVADRMPDAKTIWRYRDLWTTSDVFDGCFAGFGSQLEAHGIRESPGKMVDATFIDVPRQRNTAEENAHIKETDTAPPAWDEHPEAHERQKDIDARWAKKGNETHFGYKCHAVVSDVTKIIEDFEITAANVHDSQVCTTMLDPERDESVHADSAYRSAAIEAELAEMGITSHINFKAARNRSLTEEERDSNRIWSRTRSRVEHVFGTMTMSMDAMRLRCIGLARATGIVCLNNLAYNMLRAEQILRLNLRVP